MEGYKFVFCNAYKCCLALIKLEILPGATVVNPVAGEVEPYVESTLRYLAPPSYIYSKKHRCDKVKFIEVVDYYEFEFEPSARIDHGPYSRLSLSYTDVCITLIDPKPLVDPSITAFTSIADPEFVYRWGQEIVSDIDTDYHKDCAAGINFFDSPEDATEWMTTKVSGYWLLNRWNAFSRLVWTPKEKLYDNWI